MLDKDANAGEFMVHIPLQRVCRLPNGCEKQVLTNITFVRKDQFARKQFVQQPTRTGYCQVVHAARLRAEQPDNKTEHNVHSNFIFQHVPFGLPAVMEPLRRVVGWALDRAFGCVVKLTASSLFKTI